MKYVTFTGREDARGLGKDDFAKAGVEVDEDMMFHRGQPVKVKNALADGLTNNPELFGSFEVTELSDDEAAEVDAAAKEAEAQAAAQEEAFPDGGSTGSMQESTPAPRATTSRGSTSRSTP